MYVAFKRYCHLLWNGFLKVREEPSSKTLSVRTGRNVAAACYLSLIALSLVVSFLEIYDVEEIQSISDWDQRLLPDIIFCPRPGIAAIIQKKAPNFNDTSLNPDEFRQRYVRWLDDLAWIKRARDHESYENNVWYNLQVLDLLNMTRSHVDQFTSQVKADPEFESPLSTEIVPYLDQLRLLAQLTYEQDLDVLESNDELDNQRQWLTPIHPRLQELLATELNKSEEKRLMWWAITKTQYVMQYSEQDNQTLDYVKNQRFNCYGTSDCQHGFSTLWLDDSYCILWRGLPLNSFNLYQPDFSDDIQVWVGNLIALNINWQDFMVHLLEPNGYWIEQNDGNFNIQAFYVTMDAFRTVTNSQADMLPPVCQSMVDKLQNRVSTRLAFCDKDALPLKDFIFYRRLGVTNEVFYGFYASSVKNFAMRPQFSTWQLISLAGGTFGLICGFSIQELMKLLIVPLKKRVQQSLQFIMGITLLTVAVFFTTLDVKTALDPANRYVFNPYVTDVNDTPIPAISFAGYTFFSQLTLNHTKLSQYRVSAQLLRYLCVAATGRICGSDNKIHGTDPFKQRERLQKFWKNPTEQLFVTIRPNDSLLNLIEEEYAQLGIKLEVDTNTEPAYSILKHFFVEPCAIVLECRIGQNQPWDCCSEFTLYPAYEDLLMYALHWSNPHKLTFAHGSLTIYYDTSQYLTHSDGLAPYLGPDVTLTEAISTEGVAWKHNNWATITFDGIVSYTGVTYIRNYLVKKMANGEQFKAVLSANAEKLLTPEEYSESKCVTTPKCRYAGSELAYLRYRAFETKCPCQLYYSESYMIDLNSTKPYCVASEALRCILEDQFYSGYCHERPDLGDFKVPSFDWNYNSTDDFELVNPNVFLYAYESNYACGWGKLWQSTTSPLGKTIGIKDLESCTNVRSCLRYSHSVVVGATQFSTNFNDKSRTAFKLIVSLYDSVDPGTEQVDTFNLPAIIGFSMNSFGLFLGLSLMAIMHIAQSVIEKTRTKTTKEVIKKRWTRSVAVVRAANTFQSHSSNPSRSNEVEGKDPNVDKEEKPSIIHVLLCLMLLASSVVLVLILIPSIQIFSASTLSRYKVQFNETDIEPAFALCTTQEHTGSVHDELGNLTECTYRGQNKTCADLFPVVWRPNYPEVNGIKACVVTNQILHNSDMKVAINVSQAVYKAVHIRNTIFDRMWLGDLSTLYSTGEDKPLIFYDVSQDDEAIQLSFTIKKYRKYGACGVRPFPMLTKCYLVKTCNDHDQLCIWLTSALPELPKGIDECVRIQYEAYAMSGRGHVIANQDLGDRYKSSVRVLFRDYVWLDISERQTYNWAQQVILLGGYSDQLIGVSMLNIVFVLIWFVLRRVFLEVIAIVKTFKKFMAIKSQLEHEDDMYRKDKRIAVTDVVQQLSSVNQQHQQIESPGKRGSPPPSDSAVRNRNLFLMRTRATINPVTAEPDNLETCLGTLEHGAPSSSTAEHSEQIDCITSSN